MNKVFSWIVGIPIVLLVAALVWVYSAFAWAFCFMKAWNLYQPELLPEGAPVTFTVSFIVTVLLLMCKSFMHTQTQEDSLKLVKRSVYGIKTDIDTPMYGCPTIFLYIVSSIAKPWFMLCCAYAAYIVKLIVG